MIILKKSIFFFGIVFLIMSCGANVYMSPDAKRLANLQSSLAILPPKIRMESGQIIGGTFTQSKESESFQIQEAMFSWFLQRMGKKGALQQIQDSETTNSRLKKAGYPQKDFSKEELCTILGVDAVVSSQYVLSKPTAQSVAVASSLLIGYEPTTNKVTATIHIFDKRSKKVIWNYANEYSGTWQSNLADVITDLMRNASKNLPYVK